VVRCQRLLVSEDGSLGAGCQLLLNGDDLSLEEGGVVGAVLGLGPVLLLDELDELELEAHDVVFKAGVGHGSSVPAQAVA